MTVKELIKLLSELPPNYPVRVRTRNGYSIPLDPQDVQKDTQAERVIIIAD